MLQLIKNLLRTLFFAPAATSESMYIEPSREDDMLEKLYRNQKLAVMLASRFAQQLGLPVGLGEDPLEMGWSVLYITLPTGEQISWRMPPEDLISAWPDYKEAFDGHTSSERNERVLNYLRDSGNALPTQLMPSAVTSVPLRATND